VQPRSTATGIVGVRLDRSQFTVERENPGTKYAGRAAGTPAHREDLIVTVHAIGTAIARTPRRTSGASRLVIEPVRNMTARESVPREL
jgi:hypothetical protein